jgi:D-glycero-alpha-D-manno-heptose 1-phosphate guanylyltransferase
LVINGDTFFEIKLKELCQFHYDHNSELSLALFKSNDNKRYKTFFMDSENRLVNKIINKKQNIVNGGIYLFNDKSIITNITFIKDKISFEQDIIESLIETKFVYGFVSKDLFIDIGLPDDYFKASSVLKKYL